MNTDDGRVVGVAWRNGTLWATANDGCSGSTVACSHFWSIDTSALTLTQDFTWVPPGSGVNDYYAAPAIDARGDVGFVVSFSSSTLFPSVLLTGQSTTDASGTLETPLVVKPGYGDETHGRFGDYSAVDIDPRSGGLTYWCEGEWIPSNTADNWGTWVQSFSFTPPYVNLSVTITPAGGGSVTIGGTTYYNGSVATLMAQSYPITWSASPGHGFGSWSTSGGAALAGATLSLTGNGALVVNLPRTPTVSFAVAPASCSPVLFNATPQADGTSVVVPLGTYWAHAGNCTQFRFQAWTTTGGLTAASPSSGNTTVAVADNGTLSANWAWIPIPSYQVTLAIAPSACAGASLSFNGSTASSGQTVSVRAGSFALSVPTCPTYTFQQWSVTGSVATSGTYRTTTLNVTGNGTVTATFIPTVFSVLIITVPSGCSLSLAGTPYSNGSTAALTAQSYALTAPSCSGYIAPVFATVGGLQVTGGSLVVTDNGTVTATFYPVLGATLTGTASLQAGGNATLNYTVTGGRMPATLFWSFGDGQSARGSVDPSLRGTVSHVYANAGTFTVELMVNDSSGQHRNVTYAVRVSSPPTTGLGGLGGLLTSPLLWALVAVIVVVAVVAAVYARRRRRAREPPVQPGTPGGPAYMTPSGAPTAPPTWAGPPAQAPPAWPPPPGT